MMDLGRKLSLAGLLCAGLLGVVASGVASAQDAPVVAAPATPDAPVAAASAPPGATRASLEAAREHMEQGQARYQAGDFEAAIHEFEAAYAARSFSAFLYNAGVAAERLGQWSRAADFYERYLTGDPHSSDAADVRRNVDNLRTRALAEQPVQPIVTVTTTVEHHVVESGTETPTGTTPTETTPTGTTPTETTPTETTPTETTATETTATGTTPTGTTPTVDGLAETTTQVMKSLLSVQTEPAGATVTLRRGDRVVATGPSPFAQTLDEGEYALSVEHPDYRTIGERVRVHAGKVYVVIVEMSQGHFLGYLQVVSDPPGANVFIDGSEQGAAGQTPFRSVVDTGTHHLTLERAGFAPEERDVEVDVGAEFSLNVRLARVDYGRLRVVASQPHARVLVDGEEVGEVPYEGQVSPGSHEVEVEADGMKTFSADVTIERGQLTPMRVRLRPRPGRSAAWTTLILGVGSAGAGLYLGMRGTDLRDQLSAERDAGTLASDDPRILRGRLFYYGADVAYGLGALLGVFSIYYFLRDPLPDSDGRVLEPRDWALSPSFDRDGAGATLTGRF